MDDQTGVQQKRKRYKSFLDADYKPEDVHPLTDKRWRKEAYRVTVVEEEATPTFISGKQLSSEVQYMSSDLESFTEQSIIENRGITWEDVPNPQSAETISETYDNAETKFPEQKIDTDEERGTFSGEKFLSEVFNEMSSVLMFPDAKLTVREVSLMIIGLCVRFNLTYVVRQALFNLVKCLAGPKFKNWNVSQFKISKMYDPPDESISLCFFCVKCCRPLLPPICKVKFRCCDVVCECGEAYSLTTQKDNYIVNIDLKYQIMLLLKNSKVKSALLKNINLIKNRLDGNETTMTDIYDGVLYKELMRKYSCESHILTYVFNTDGAPIFHSSKRSLWPIQIIINELPPDLRFKYPLLAGICILKNEPSPQVMNMYVEQFMEQTKYLREEGFKIISNESNESITMKLLPLWSSVDSVARPIIQNRFQYNGHYGCSWCYDFGKYDQTMRYPVTEETANLRTDTSHRQDVASAEKHGRPVNGVKGASSLMTILCFNMVWGFPVDYMHGVLLGVVKQFWESWMKMKLLKARNIHRINELLSQITPPREIHRQPRPFTDKAHWKATEWKSWILFYALPCLHRTLPVEYFEHLSLFVRTIFTLLKTSITENELRKCEEDLITVVVRSEQLYGITFMTFNVHSLLHLIDSVRMSGPLWATSTFAFESAIYQLKQQVTGPNGIYDQIAKRMFRKIAFRCTYERLFKPSPTCLKFCDSLFNNTHRCISTTANEALEKAVLIGREVMNSEGQQIFDRCHYKNTLHHSTLYSRPDKTNDAVVQLRSVCFAEIINFVLENDTVLCKVEILHVNNDNDLPNVEHIFRVTRDQTIRVVPIDELQEKMLYMNIESCEYISKLPNIFEVQ